VEGASIRSSQKWSVKALDRACVAGAERSPVTTPDPITTAGEASCEEELPPFEPNDPSELCLERPRPGGVDGR
jgi:hypothetical protein